MPKFDVLFTSASYRYAYETIEAETAEAAKAIAQYLLQNSLLELEWEFDDSTERVDRVTEQDE